MKTLIISCLAMLSVTCFAQTVTDLRGKKVTQSGSSYSVVSDKRSDNGGTLHETWSGKIINGKREGTWKFTGSYKRFQWSGNVFYTGTVTMTRSYKNGIPHGQYSINANITQEVGEYNYVTGQWIYADKQYYPEKVTGSFIEGKPNDTWTCHSNRNSENFTISFSSGTPIGTWKRTLGSSNLTCSFDNGHLISLKSINDAGVWGEELVYDTDPRTLPKDSVSLSNFIFMWDSYSEGLPITTEYREYYPQGSSEEKTTVYYTISEYEKHLKQFGNVPAHAKVNYEQKFEEKQNLAIRTIIEKMTYDANLELQKNHVAKLFNNNSKLLYSFIDDNWYNILKQEVMRDSILPKYLNRLKKYKNSKSYRKFMSEYSDTISYVKLYHDKKLNELKEYLKSKGVHNVDTMNNFIYKYGNNPYFDRRIEQHLEHQTKIEKQQRINNSFKLTEDDILAYICWKTDLVKATASTSTGKVSFKIIGKDASDISKEDVITFAKKYLSENNTRTYDSLRSTVHIQTNVYKYYLIEMMDKFRDNKKYLKLRATIKF